MGKGTRTRTGETEAEAAFEQYLRGEVRGGRQIEICLFCFIFNLASKSG